MLGDVDEDGDIDAADASAILVAAANMGSGIESGLTNSQTLAGDIDGDGELSATDASYLLMYCAEIGAGADISLEDYLAAILD